MCMSRVCARVCTCVYMCGCVRHTTHVVGFSCVSFRVVEGYIVHFRRGFFFLSIIFFSSSSPSLTGGVNEENIKKIRIDV